MGWNVHGSAWHLCDGAGANSIWAKPLAALAVMEPVWPVDVSLTVVTRPSGESWIATGTWSPCLITNSVCAAWDSDGSNVARVEASGFGGARVAPVVVRNAKFAYSTPTWA